MKKQLYTMAAMMILAGFVAMSSAKAQTNASRQLIANIPFEFSVGDKAMPAGNYTVRQINPGSDNAILQLRSKDGSAGAMLQMTSVLGKTQASARLVFHRYGNQYFFAQAWTTGDSEGLEAPRSRGERGMVERIAGVAPTNESIALASRK